MGCQYRLECHRPGPIPPKARKAHPPEGLEENAVFCPRAQHQAYGGAHGPRRERPQKPCRVAVSLCSFSYFPRLLTMSPSLADNPSFADNPPSLAAILSLLQATPFPLPATPHLPAIYNNHFAPKSHHSGLIIDDFWGLFPSFCDEEAGARISKRYALNAISERAKQSKQKVFQKKDK